MKLLVANRGEIAVRILRAAAEEGLDPVAVYAEDDADSLHTRMADLARPLRGVGVPAYLDADQLIAVALDARLAARPDRTNEGPEGGPGARVGPDKDGPTTRQVG